MNFVMKPSLEHMALVKIAILLWNQNDVRSLISKQPCYGNRYLSEKWKSIEERVIEKISQLLLPQSLKEKVLGFIKPIGLQLFKWKKFHCSLFRLRVNLPAELSWTPQGTVDRKKTAEVLVKDENLDIYTRYELACLYCLEDDIDKFWNNMPECQKESAFGFPIISFWTHNVKRRRGPISYRTAFNQGVDSGNKVAAEYFLQKLTPRDREESLVETVKYVKVNEVLYFLLSKMDKKQQMEVFKNNPDRVLKCFLQWPFQSFFTKVANYMWNFLSKNDYNSILIDIVHKVRDGYKDWDYQKLFREFWLESPGALKSCITDDLDRGCLFTFLLHNKDKENVILIVKDATLAAKEKFIYSHTGKDFCEYFIRDNEWDFLEFYIREFLPSKNEMLKFKEEFEKLLMYPDVKKYFSGKEHKWDKLFHLSEDSICKYSKRSAEVGECSSSKRFQSLQ